MYYITHRNYKNLIEYVKKGGQVDLNIVLQICSGQSADFRTFSVKCQQHERHQSNTLNWQDKSLCLVLYISYYLLPFTSPYADTHNKIQPVLWYQRS